MNMAAARSSARPEDPRVACSLCGGLIHPIAGRCKHCKSDLTAARSARPAASSGLPSLAPVKKEPALVIPLPVTAPNTVAQAKPHAVVSAPISAEESKPILPPRPTGRMEASGTSARRTTWPYIVIGLALAAIAVAVVLLVIPNDDAAKDAGRYDPPPAPDRMNTDPKAAPGGPKTDPWSAIPDPKGPGPLAQITPPDPVPTKPNPFAPDPTPPGKVQPPDIDDLVIPDPSLGQNLRNPFNTSGTAMIVAMAKHACDRMTTCSKDPVTSATCSALTSNMASIDPPPTCAAAQRCLSKIDQLSCDDLGNDIDDPFDASFLSSMAMSVQDCMTAISC